MRTGKIIIPFAESVAKLAQFTPIPALGPAIELLGKIIQLCNNVSVNREDARQLAQRCIELVEVLQKRQMTNALNVEAACSDFYSLLEEVHTKMDVWSKVGRLPAFAKQEAIRQDIDRCNLLLSNFEQKFQLLMLMEIHGGNELSAQVAEQNQHQILERLAKIQAAVDTTSQASGDGQYCQGEVIIISSHPVRTTKYIEVFEGLYRQKTKVAVKVLRLQPANTGVPKARFMREIGIWTKVWEADHTNILPFVGFDDRDGERRSCIISIWPVNGTAIEYVKLNDRNVNYKDLFIGIARGVRTLHGLEIVHGELKGEHIAIGEAGNPQIADFGLSRIVLDLSGAQFSQSEGLDKSLRWFAPEMFSGDGLVSKQTDIYALGMTVLELLTHARPFDDLRHGTDVAMKYRLRERPPRPESPQVIRRGLDDLFWSLITACWAHEPIHRPSIEQFLTILEAN